MFADARTWMRSLALKTIGVGAFEVLNWNTIATESAATNC
jgi:hypothetical protein